MSYADSCRAGEGTVKHYLPFVLVLCLLGACGSNPTASPVPAPSPTLTLSPVSIVTEDWGEPCHVTYKVYGTAKEAYVAWTEPGMGPGIPERRYIMPHLVNAPWEEAMTYRYCRPGTDLEVDYAPGSSGSLTCELWVDVELKDTETRSAGSLGCYCSWSTQ